MLGRSLLRRGIGRIARNYVIEQRQFASRDIAKVILVARDRAVLLDADLASLYGVTTKALNQAVKRNAARFPADFAFRLSVQETTALNKLSGGTEPAEASRPAESAVRIHRTRRDHARDDSQERQSG
jgi:hypothetical protein